MTYEALATAFGRNLELHEDSAAKMRSYYASKNLTVKKVMLRMVTLPQCKSLLAVKPLQIAKKTFYFNIKSSFSVFF